MTGPLAATAKPELCAPGAASPLTPAYGFMAPQPLLAQSSVGVGHITPILDTDGSIRRVPAMVCFEGQAYPALAVAGLVAATGAQPMVSTNKPGLFTTNTPKTIDIGGLHLPVDAQGQMRVSYQMPRAGFASVSAVDVLQGKVPPSLLKGAWVLVGSTAFGGGDAVPTPQGGAVGGVEVHAQMMSAALDGGTPFVPAWAPLWPLATGLLALMRQEWALAVELMEQLRAVQGDKTPPFTYVMLVRALRCNLDPVRALEVANEGLKQYPDQIELAAETETLKDFAMSSKANATAEH